MLTRKEFAEAFVEDYCKGHGFNRKEAKQHIYASSCLAVALDFLGELSDDLDAKAYASERAGILYSYIVKDNEGKFENVKYLTMRDMLDILPEN